MLTTPGIKPAELQKQLDGPRPAAGDRRRPGAQARSAGAAARLPTSASVEVARVPRRRPRRPRGGVQAHAGLEGRRGGGRAARLAGRAARRERRRLGRPLQGAGGDRAAGTRTSAASRCPTRTSSRRRTSRAHARWCRSGSGSTAPPPRLDGRHAERPARHRHRVGEGAPRRAGALEDDGEHGRGVDRPRLRGHRREHAATARRSRSR